MKILHLYPNLNMVYENLVEGDRNRFEEYLIDQFTIEKRSLDQILKKICYPASCIQQTNIYHQKIIKK